MARIITVAAAQMGPIPHETEPGAEPVRRAALDRMLVLLENAAKKGARLVVFPELALTTFFPRALLTDVAALTSVFEPESAATGIVTSPHLQPLFARATALGVDVSLGYAERWTTPAASSGTAAPTTTDYNTAVYFSAATGDILAKYRKVHLPGRTTLLPEGSAQQLEKLYFSPGDLGFEAFRVPGLVAGSRKAEDDAGSTSAPDSAGDPIVGMLICNDRRWPEAWRCYGLQGVELVLCGFNTTDYKPQEEAALGDAAAQEALALLHHHISCQGGSYSNACFSIHVAKAGIEAPGAGGGLIAGTVIYDPLGRKVAESATKGDELLVATLDLDLCRRQKETIFNFASHRRVEHYRRLVEQVGVVEPPLLSRKVGQK